MVLLTLDSLDSWQAHTERLIRERARLLRDIQQQHNQHLVAVNASFDRLTPCQPEASGSLSQYQPEASEASNMSGASEDHSPVSKEKVRVGFTADLAQWAYTEHSSEEPVQETRSRKKEDLDSDVISKRSSNPSGPSGRTRKVPTLTVLLAESRSYRTLCERLIQFFVDYVAAAVVLLNCLALLVQLELEGRSVAWQNSFGDEGHDFQPVLPSFQRAESIFVFFFCAELLLRMAVERMAWIKDVANWIDLVLVAAGLLDLGLGMLQNDSENVTLKFITTMKAFRAIRMLRSFRFFRGLRMLVKACQCCLPSLCWSMLLLAVFMCMGGLILGNLLQSFIQDEQQVVEDRKWVWEHYGTAYRATYTLYEITFAGNWPVNVRPILEKVSPAFVMFYLAYITVIVFAVIRVISAIFLKDTLDEATKDAQHMVVERMREKAAYVDKLEGAFRTIQADGIINEPMLTELLDNPKVKAYFQTLEIDVREGAALFKLLSHNGEDDVTCDEFIDGIMRCKGPARAIDTVALQADLRQLDVKVTKLVKKLSGRKSWNALQTTERQGHQAEHMKAFRFESAAPMMRQISP